jgi:hypothetical protein
MGVLGQSRDQGAAAVAPPMQGPVDPTGFFSNIGAGFRQSVAGTHSTRVGQAISEKNIYDQVITALQAEGEQGEDTNGLTGEKVRRPFRNPYVSEPWENLLNPSYNPIAGLYGGGDQAEKSQLFAAVERVRQRKPDFLKAFPNQGALEAYAIAQRQKKTAAAQSVTARANTSGQIGSFLGGMAGSIASLDPENAVGAGFGTAAGKTFARTLIRRSVEGAGVNAAASLVGTPGQVADAQRLGQEMTPTDVEHQVLQSAAIGAAFGGAHVLIPETGKAVRKGVSTVAGKLAENLPDQVRDPLVAASIRAGTVKDREMLHEWQRLHAPFGVVDTSSPDERAAAHTIVRDADNRELSPLHPDAAVHNENRLSAVARSLGVNLSTTELPSPAPIQQATIRDRSGGASSRRPASYEEAVHATEGTGHNPHSSADGHFQFTEGTWLEYAPKVSDTAGMSTKQILALRHDLPTAQRAERLFRADNAIYLRQRGLEDSPGNLSLAHFLGKADAAKVLSAAPETPIERLIDPKSLAANRPILQGKSASEVVAWAHKRIGATVNMPVARADAVPDADGLDEGDYAEVPYQRAIFKPDDIQTDAALMQYKGGGDEQGVTSKLKDVTAWNPLASSEILVWEANDGRRIVVDGHQRVGLAKRLNDPNIELPALVVKESDGITAAQARTLGALRNINIGTGSLIDNARVLRDIPEGADMIKGAEHRREIEGLSKLSYEAFGAAVNDVVDPRIAAEIGHYAPPDAHMAMVELLHREHIHNPIEAGNVIRQAVADGFGSAKEHQLGMFGSEPQQSLYVPIARIMAAAQKKLREEKRTFKVLGDKAGRIEAAGNVLDKTANESKVIGSEEALGILNATAHRTGPVRDALVSAARAELSGARRADAVSRFIDDLSGIDLRAAAAGIGEDSPASQPPGEAGGRDAAAEADRVLSESDGPSLYDHAVAARDAAERFSDPAGEGAKFQTEILDHDLRMDAMPLAERVAFALDYPNADYRGRDQLLNPRRNILRAFGDGQNLELARLDQERRSELRQALGSERFDAIEAAANSGDETLALSTITAADIAAIARFDEATLDRHTLVLAEAGNENARQYLASKGLWPRRAYNLSPSEITSSQGQFSAADLHALATENQPLLVNVASDIEEATGAEVKDPGIKTLARIEEKVRLEGYDHAGQIKDATRIAFVVSTPEQAADVANRVLVAFPEHADKGVQSLSHNGYTDHKIIVRFENGGVGEVQIVPDVLWEQKYGSGIGRVYQAARATGDLAERDRLNKLQREAYAAALADSPFRNWSTNEKSASGNEALASGSESAVPSVEDLPTNPGASRQPDGFQANARPDLGSDQSTATSRSSTSNSSTLIEEASSAKVEIDGSKVNETDPNIAARQAQEVALRTQSPMRSIEEQHSTMGLGLFDVADQPTFRLSDEGDAKPLAEIMREAEDDELAAKALRDCLKGGGE